MKFDFKKIICNIYLKNLFLMAVLVLAIVFGTLYWLKGYTRHDQKVIVPTLKGLQVEEAAAILHSVKLKYEVVDSIYEKRGVPGAVLEQVPFENSTVKEDRTVYLIVQAKAEQLVSIPDLADYSQRQAESLLNALGFTNIKIEQVSSDYKGLVISVEYKGVQLAEGQKIPKGSVLLMKVGDGLGGTTSDTIQEYPETDPLF